MCGGQLDKTREKNPVDIQKKIGNNAIAIYSTENAFTALKGDGQIVTWPKDSFGGDSSQVKERITSIFANSFAFAAITKPGDVVAWRNKDFGGTIGKDIENQLCGKVRSIASTATAFAALTRTGKVLTWGSAATGGDPSEQTQELLNRNVQFIYATESAFAALKKNGDFITSGDESTGGGRVRVRPDSSKGLADKIAGVRWIYASNFSFSAISKDRIVTWGSQEAEWITTIPGDERFSKVVSSSEAYAGLTKKGRVITWGRQDFGGRPPQDIQPLLMDKVVDIHATYGAIAAIRSDGRLVTWGIVTLVARMCLIFPGWQTVFRDLLRIDYKAFMETQSCRNLCVSRDQSFLS